MAALRVKPPEGGELAHTTQELKEMVEQLLDRYLTYLRGGGEGITPPSGVDSALLTAASTTVSDTRGTSAQERGDRIVKYLLLVLEGKSRLSEARLDELNGLIPGAEAPQEAPAPVQQPVTPVQAPVQQQPTFRAEAEAAVAAPTTEEEQGELQEKYEHGFSRLLTYLMNPAFGATNPNDMVTALSGTFAGMTADQMPGFKTWLGTIFKELQGLSTAEQYDEFFRKYLPDREINVGASESLRASLDAMKVILGTYVDSDGYFRLDDFVTQYSAAIGVLNSYLERSASVREGYWTLKDQQAFVAVLSGEQVVENAANSRGRALAERFNAYSTEASGKLMDFLVESLFCYDWEVMMQELDIPEDARTGLMALDPAARMASLQLMVLDNFEFTRQRDECVRYMSELGATLEEGTSALQIFQKTDLFTQYAFVMKAWPQIRDRTLTYYRAEEVEEGEEGLGAVSEVPLEEVSKQEREALLLNTIVTYVNNIWRTGHLGFMLYAVPMAMDESSSVDQVIRILDTVTGSAAFTEGTSTFDSVGAQRVMAEYTMEQVPRNFIEARTAYYEQMVDLLLLRPYASSPESRNMDAQMFETEGIAERIRRVLQTASLLSGAVRPEEIRHRLAPQDWNMLSTLNEQEYRILRMAAYDMFSNPDMNSEDFSTAFNNLMSSGLDEELTSWWDARDASVHEMFFDFFRPASVEVVPERSYTITPMIPVSETDLLRRLATVEFDGRTVHWPDVSGAELNFRGRERRVGLNEDELLNQRFEGTAAVFGPTYVGRATGRYQQRTVTEGMTDDEIAAARANLPLEQQTAEYVAGLTTEERAEWEVRVMSGEIPAFNTDWGTFSTAVSYRESEGGREIRLYDADGAAVGGPITAVDNTALIADLDWRSEQENSTAFAYISRYTSTNAQGEEVENFRAYVFGKIENQWYRVSYIDLDAMDMQKLFTSLNMIDLIGVEARTLAGAERFPETPTEAEPGWNLQGMLVGLNFGLITGGAMEGILDYGAFVFSDRSREARMMGSETQDTPLGIMREYAFGTATVLKNIGALSEGVVFTAGVVRPSATVTEGGVTTEEERGRGGGGAIFRGEFGEVETPRGGTERAAAEAVLGAEEMPGEEAVTFTFGWQDRNVIASGWYTRFIGQIAYDLKYRGLVGAMYNGSELEAFFTLSTDIHRMRTDESYDYTGGALGGFRWGGEAREENLLQVSGFYRYNAMMTRIEQIRGQLADSLERREELQRTAPVDVEQQNVRVEEMAELNRRIEKLEQMSTALGLITASNFLGTVKYVNKASENARWGVEGLVGASGWESWGWMVNGFVEIDDTVAGTLNLSGYNNISSIGTKWVVPAGDFMIAVLAGGYFGEMPAGTVTGGSAYAGVAYSNEEEGYGAGVIGGGGRRTVDLMLGEGEAGQQEINRERTLGEVVVLGWFEVGPDGTPVRVQPYFVVSHEEGSATYTVADVQGRTDITGLRIGAGTRVTWIDQHGTSYTVDGSFLMRESEFTQAPEAGAERGAYEESFYGGSLSAEVSPSETFTGGVVFNIGQLQNHLTSNIGRYQQYDGSALLWSLGAYARFEW